MLLVVIPRSEITEKIRGRRPRPPSLHTNSP
uniref:Uncharacterized protein n=1 Tax=Siphoviridae sp. ctpoI7 TaxID=2825678 RepID=A0A8S5P8S1_9CAUD|nr:MAG TPA: hypothetical protein [Siphoviridae sp. ctpoI7]